MFYSVSLNFSVNVNLVFVTQLGGNHSVTQKNFVSQLIWRRKYRNRDAVKTIKFDAARGEFWQFQVNQFYIVSPLLI
jgi:hypothetical protein